MRRLGIDAGSYSIKLVVIGEDGIIYKKVECPHYNKVKQTVCELLKGMEGEYSLAVTGSLCEALNAPEACRIDMQTAMLTGMRLVAGTKSMLFLGAEDICYAEQEKGFLPKISRESECFVGAGKLFEELSENWGISLDELSEMTVQAKSVPMIKGRCCLLTEAAVNEKIRKGFSKADVLLGCCYAFAVNLKANVLKGCRALTPVYLAGGMSQNKGVVRALKIMLGLKDKDVVTNEMSVFTAAVGCAGKAKTLVNIEDFSEKIKNISALEENKTGPLPAYKPEEQEIEIVRLSPGEKAYLGIDIGTENICMALLNASKQLVYHSTVSYCGRPIDTVNTELMKMHQRVHGLGRPRIAVTGCGREETADKVHATLVINEVSALGAAGLLLCPEADALFELGSAKSLYIKNNGSRIIDFTMNTGCSAGAGDFFSKMVRRLGLSYEEFDQLAFKSKNPCEIEVGCIPLVEKRIQRYAVTCRLEDVCAGIAIAVAKAFIIRIDGKDFDRVTLLGKISNSRAVVSAFRLITGKQVMAPANAHDFGAIGAALLLIDKIQITLSNEGNVEKNARLEKENEELLLLEYDAPKKTSGRKILGIPRIFNMGRVFPFFARAFSEFEVDILLSPNSDGDITRDAHQLAAVDICYPAKLAFGHVAWLVEHKADYIFVPTVSSLKNEMDEECLESACPYMQALPQILEKTFRLKEKGIRLIDGEVFLDCGRKPNYDSLIGLAEKLDIPKRKFIAAANEGYASLTDYLQRVAAVEKESIAGSEPVFVLVTDYKNVLDPAIGFIKDCLDGMGCRYAYLKHKDVIRGEQRNIYPVYITMHGCERDRQRLRDFVDRMKGRQYLLLELDENSSEQGMKSAIEAFVYAVNPQTYFMIEDTSLARQDIKKTDMGIYNGLISEPLEEMIARKDYKDCFAGLLEAEKRAFISDNKRIVIGDPYRIYGENIRDNIMPLSEYILFRSMEMDTDRKYSGRLKAWRKMHELARKQTGGDYYTGIDDINAALGGRLDTVVGRSLAYRLGKLLCLSKNSTERALLYTYENENEALILEYILMNDSKALHVPFDIIRGICNTCNQERN